ncbi:sensor domain-containing diguanylate cyclase [Fusibacter ferrireducens]|uniref:GGDEF domain-containing protein n=1 Tax=Fusibacter ferrireducens TaxID=2785058 RepID=A0ABR9ZTA8_9FIRM|nr:sensor domain-containing diguanylate cyclase [Fusibacter ferrireducens]MBF4693196.1 GGDEF domain-containing protein [Fusibacter ferrireducens]
MNKFNYHIVLHFVMILASSMVFVFIVSKLIQWSLLFAVFFLTISLFGLYLLLVMRYTRFQRLINKTLVNIREEMVDTPIYDKILPATSIEDKIGLLQSYHLSSDEFEKNIQLVLEYIKQSHNTILELNRLNYCKESTLDTILAVSNHILDRNADEAFYTLILESAIDVIENATKGSLLILNAETNRYEYQAAVGFDLEYLKNIDYALEETFLYQGEDNKIYKPLVVSDVQNFSNTTLSEETIGWLSKANWLEGKEALSSPIIIDNKLYAILNIDSSQKNAFDEVDIQLIQFFSAQISIAIRNKLLVDETIKLSKFDKLTGAYNRNYFEKIFESHNEISLENLEPYAIVLCDLNFLKSINDTFGHTAGDLVLSEFSNIIQNSIRDSDIFSRVGGDEFVLLLKNIRYSKAEEKMASIFDKFEYYTINFSGHKLPVSFSYGLAASPDDSMVYDVLIKIADIRMYEFKKNYKETHQDILNSILS